MRIEINDAVRAELQELHDDNEGLTEELVVEASREAGSALHGMFLWNDEAEAARIGRLEIARTLIRRITIIRREAEEWEVRPTIRKYHGLGDGYHDVRTIMSRRDLRARLLEEALAALERLEQRYAALEELAGVFAAAEQLRRRRGG